MKNRLLIMLVSAGAAFLLCDSAHAQWFGQPYWNPPMQVWASSILDNSFSATQTVNGWAGSFNYQQGLHGNDGSGYGMWLTGIGGGGGVNKKSPSNIEAPAWIAYDLGTVYPLASINIWNYNQSVGLGRGLKNVAIDISIDNINWTRIYQGNLNKATGLDYMPWTDDINCFAPARYVVINAFSHWDNEDGDYYGLSEVRFNLQGPQAMLPAPKNTAVNTLMELQLSWKPGLNAVRHDIYFGESFSSVRDATITSTLGVYKGRQDPNSYNTGQLSPGRTYYWRIDEIDQNQTLTKGNIWSFTVGDGFCKSPFPIDKRIQQPRNVTLTWNPGLFASQTNGNDVYFGTNFNDVNNADLNSVEYITTQDSNSFNPGILLPGNTYYWRVDAIDGSQCWKGPVWSFKVNNVDWDDFRGLALKWLYNDCSYPDWCGGADYDYNGKVDFYDYAQFADIWAKKPLRLMPVGDSITRGLTNVEWVPGGYRTKLYNRIVNELFDIDFVGTACDNPNFDDLPDPDHEGHGGYTIDLISASITTWVTQAQPDIVLVHLGTNDVAQDYQLSTAPARLDSLISKIVSTAPQANVFVAKIITSTNSGEAAQIASFNAAIPAIVASYAANNKNVWLVDMNSEISLDLFYDIYHPNKAGYDKMADVWFESIMQLYYNGS